MCWAGRRHAGILVMSPDGHLSMTGQTDPAALAEHRPYLRRIAGVRFDDRLRGRVDESDLVQDALADAARELPAYTARPALPLRLWLRQLLLDALTAARRRHLLADARAAGREVDLSAGSVMWADGHLPAGGPSPGSEAGDRERAELVRTAVERLDPPDREVIALRTFEGLTTAEAAAVLGVSPEATSKRFVRALARLRAELKSLGVLVGSVRSNYGCEGDLGEYVELYRLRRFGPHFPHRLGISTKLVLHPDHRTGTLMPRLCLAGFTHTVETHGFGGLFGLIDARPPLDHYFRRLGYRQIGPPFPHPAAGQVVPMCLPIYDRDHLLRVRSPFAKLVPAVDHPSVGWFYREFAPELAEYADPIEAAASTGRNSRPSSAPEWPKESDPSPGSPST